MFTTSLTAAILGGVFASGTLDSLKWQSSYREAAVVSAEQRKPIIVFITDGSPGKLVKEGALGKDAVKLLRDGFVPLNVNTSTEAGKELAKTFNLTEGLVISDRAGIVQALRHDGTLTDAELKGYLDRFGGSAVIATTEYRGAAFAPQIQPQYQPQYAQPRPVLNALQNVGGYVQNAGANARVTVGGFVQNIGGFSSGST